MQYMKALVKEKRERGLTLTKVPVPEDLEENEVLIKVKFASICGTDLHIFEWNQWAQNRIMPPLVAGHEFAGEVISIGKSVKRVKPGDFVSAETHIPCMSCRMCRTGNMHICMNMKILGVDTNGIFAEYAKVPEVVLWKNDKNLREEFASVQEPLGNAVFTVSEGQVPGKSVLISGAGPIGLMAVQVARAMGAAPIIVSEINDFRLELALKNKADFVINPKKEDALKRILEITNGEGIEVVLEMSGNQNALNLGIDALMPHGKLSILGLFEEKVQINLNKGIFKNFSLEGITGRKMFETWYILSNLLKYNRIDLSSIVTHILPFGEWEKGFDLMEKGNCGKVVLSL